jgi:hypothetical protein
MKVFMRSLAILATALCASTAHADTFENHDTFGLDVTTLWEPTNRDAFGAGPMFRAEGFSSRFPDWLGGVTRLGLILDSADRIFAGGSFGALIRPGRSGLYGTLEATVTMTSLDEMTDAYRIDWSAGAAVGWRVGLWDLRASLLYGGLFEREVWLFSIGRDFVRLDAKVTRTTL